MLLAVLTLHHVLLRRVLRLLVNRPTLSLMEFVLVSQISILVPPNCAQTVLRIAQPVIVVLCVVHVLAHLIYRLMVLVCVTLTSSFLQ